MHPFPSPRLAVFIAIVSVTIWGAFALLVVVVGPSSKVSPPMPTTASAIAEDVAVAVAEALPVSTSKNDRLPWPPPAKPEPTVKAAEPIDYAQAEAEVEKNVRRAHAEADLCQRHGMHKVWTKDGRRWRCRR